MRLQKFNFKKSSYERPNRKWSCGRKDEACPCKQGPIEKPFLNLFTSRCSQNENPCQPKRTVRGQRALLTLSITLFTLALVSYLLFNSSQKEDFIIPGPLSSHHSTIPQSQNCNVCHSLSDPKWIQAAATSHSRLEDSKNCLKCHHFNHQHMDNITDWVHAGKNTHKPIDIAGLNPHNLKDSSVLPDSNNNFEQVACSTCHSEHQGAHFDQKQMTDKRCQNCHENKIDRFGKDHPDFVLYPYKKDNYVQYNHSTHENEFIKQGRKDLLGTPNCIKCHMRTADTESVINHSTFNNVCNDCHNVEPVNIKVLALHQVRKMNSQEMKSLVKSEKDHFKEVKDLNNPSLKRYYNDKQKLWETLQNNGDISQSIPNADKVQQLAKIPKEKIQELTQNYWDDLLFLQKASKHDNAFFHASIWSITKQLQEKHPYIGEKDFNKLNILSRTLWNDPILRQNLEHFLLSQKLDKSQNYQEFVQNLQISQVQKILKSVQSFYQSSGTTLRPIYLKSNQTNIYLRSLKEQKLSQSQLEKALPPLNRILKKSKNWPKSFQSFLKKIQYAKSLKGKKMPKPQSSSLHYKNYLNSLEKLIRKNKTLAQELTSLLQHEKSLNPLFLSQISKDKKIQKTFKALTRLKYIKGQWTDKKKNPIELQHYELLIQLSASIVLDKIAEESKKQIPKIAATPKWQPKENNLWMVEDKGNRSLSYKTTGHADPLLLQSYLHPDLQNKLLSAAKIKNKDLGIGSCQKCHKNISSERIENWVSPVPQKTLTKFSHGPHSNKCSECHMPRDGSDKQLAQDYPNYSKDFKPMNKESCMKCHKKNGANDSCLQCHNYHTSDYDKTRREVMNLLKKYKK